MTLQVKLLDKVGAEVFGFDINSAISAEMQAQLKALWYEHGILLFRGQDRYYLIRNGCNASFEVIKLVVTGSNDCEVHKGWAIDFGHLALAV